MWNEQNRRKTGIGGTAELRSRSNNTALTQRLKTFKEGSPKPHKMPLIHTQQEPVPLIKGGQTQNAKEMLDFLKDPQRVFQENYKKMGRRQKAQSFTNRIVKHRRSPRRPPVETPLEANSKEIIDIEITQDSKQAEKSSHVETKQKEVVDKKVGAPNNNYTVSENESNAICSNGY